MADETSRLAPPTSPRPCRRDTPRQTRQTHFSPPTEVMPVLHRQLERDFRRRRPRVAVKNLLQSPRASGISRWASTIAGSLPSPSIVVCATRIQLPANSRVDLRNAMPMHVAPQARHAIQISIPSLSMRYIPCASVMISASSASHCRMCVNGCQMNWRSSWRRVRVSIGESEAELAPATHLAPGESPGAKWVAGPFGFLVSGFHTHLGGRFSDQSNPSRSTCVDPTMAESFCTYSSAVHPESRWPCDPSASETTTKNRSDIGRTDRSIPPSPHRARLRRIAQIPPALIHELRFQHRPVIRRGPQRRAGRCALVDRKNTRASPAASSFERIN